MAGHRGGFQRVPDALLGGLSQRIDALTEALTACQRERDDFAANLEAEKLHRAGLQDSVDRCALRVQELSAALTACRAQGEAMREAPQCNVSELRGGEDGDGPIESTDLLIEGRGISLLVNVVAGSSFSYSLAVDGVRQRAKGKP